jgi:hypothetical protein
VDWTGFFPSIGTTGFSSRGETTADSGFTLCPHPLERLTPVRMVIATRIRAKRTFRSLERNSKYILVYLLTGLLEVKHIITKC